MRLPQYERYKQSGAEWLGRVPDHWQVKRIASCFSEVVEPGDPGLPVLSVSIHSGVSDSELSEDEMDRKVTRSEDKTKYKRVHEGDLVYNMMRAWQGAFGTVSVEGMVSPAYVVARPTGNTPTIWIEYLLRTNQAIKEIKRFSRGITDFRLRLYWEEFKNIKICLPDIAEQRVILEFLDRETTKIDALITEQERLIELLQEKRQAVISHAVTKGLNPNATLKDSGVEWLGEVPEHWGVKKASWLFETSKGRNAQDLTQEYCAENSGEFPVFSGQTKNDGVMGYVDSFEFDVSEEGVILTTTVGAKAMSIRLITNKFSLSQNCMIISPRCKEVLAKYYAYGFQPSFLYERSLIPDHMQPSFRMEDFSQLWIQVPPMEEQQKIYKHIEEQEEESLSLEREVVRAISLLEERRSALISAAVTGQIDVRSPVSEEEAI